MSSERANGSDGRLFAFGRHVMTLCLGVATSRRKAVWGPKRTVKLGIINGHVLELPDRLIRPLSQHPSVFRMHLDRPAAKFNYRTSLTVGTRAVRQTLGLTGAGVGVAVIDSGIATFHDDLTNNSATLYQYGNQRVTTFVDFVNGQANPYDDNGHGTHVAGIIAGNG